MQCNYEQQIHRRNQSSAEVEALRILWGGIMKHFTPEARRFETWLRLIGYVETTRSISDVHRQFIRLHGMMLPGELIRYMDRLVARTLMSQRSREKGTNQTHGGPSAGCSRQLHGDSRWKNSKH
jgi:hypothetical protein